MFKRGELTTQQLVVLIVLIVSFAVILFLLTRLDLGDVSNKELCRNSVILKTQSKLVSGSLDCRTNYVCISSDGECDEFVSTVTVNAETREEITKILDKELSDCWWMFGEGEVNYLDFSDREFLGETHCAICSILKFDKKIQADFPEIDFNGEKISTSEKYSVVTGIKEGAAWENLYAFNFIDPNLTKSDEVGSGLGCKNFITKA